MDQQILDPKSFESRAFPTLDGTNAVFRRPSEEETGIGKGNSNFDAIFQFRDTFLTAQLRHSLSSKGYVLEFQAVFTESGLSTTARSAVRTTVQALNERMATMPGAERGDFAPVGFRVRLLHPTLTLTPGDPDSEARVDWSVQVYLRLARGQDLLTKGEHEYLDEPLANGSLYHYPALKAGKSEVEHRLWALLDFSGATATVSATDPLFLDLLNSGFLPGKTLEAATVDALAPLSKDELRVTPRMCLAGEMLKGETLAGYGAFSVHTAIKTLAAGHLLCLCVDATVGGGGAGLGMVRPFLGSRSFAWYFSQPLLQAVVALRWARKGTIREFTAETSVPLQDPDNEKNTVFGRARVKWRWTGLVGAYVAHVPGSTGAVRLKTVGDLTVLKLWDHKEEAVDSGDYPALFKPVMQGQSVDFELFETGKSDVQEAVRKLGYQLFQPLYRPTVAKGFLTNVSGVLSGAVWGGVARGDLSTEGA